MNPKQNSSALTLFDEAQIVTAAIEKTTKTEVTLTQTRTLTRTLTLILTLILTLTLIEKSTTWTCTSRPPIPVRTLACTTTPSSHPRHQTHPALSFTCRSARFAASPVTTTPGARNARRPSKCQASSVLHAAQRGTQRGIAKATARAWLACCRRAAPASPLARLMTMISPRLMPSSSGDLAERCDGLTSYVCAQRRRVRRGLRVDRSESDDAAWSWLMPRVPRGLCGQDRSGKRAAAGVRVPPGRAWWLVPQSANSREIIECGNQCRMRDGPRGLIPVACALAMCHRHALYSMSG